MKVVLKVEQVTVGRAKECGGDLTFPLQQEKLVRVLKHQVRGRCQPRRIFNLIGVLLNLAL